MRSLRARAIAAALVGLLASAPLSAAAADFPTQSTFSPNGNFPFTRDTYVQGGLQVVATLTDRDNIPTLRAKVGMLVYVQANSTMYQLASTGPYVWTAFNTGVSSVGGTSPIASSGGPTPVISCPTCITSTTSAGGDLSGTYPNPTVAKLQGTAVSSTGPTAGQYLAYNGGTLQWEPTTTTQNYQTIKDSTGSAMPAQPNEKFTDAFALSNVAPDTVIDLATRLSASSAGDSSHVPALIWNKYGELTAVVSTAIDATAIGAVTSVGGTAPVVSSGGQTPAISCPTCLTGSPSAAGDMPFSTTGSQGMTLLAIGAANKMMRSTGTAPAWSVPTWPNAFTQGDTLVATGANAVGVVAAAAAGKLYRATGAGAVSAYSAGTFPDDVAQGDLLYGATAHNWDRLPVGSVHQLLHGGTTVPGYAAVDLTADVTGVLPIANGGTNSGTALSGSGAIMVENGTAIVKGPAGTTTTLLHGNASGLPAYGPVSMTADISGIAPIVNGGTNSGSIGTAGEVAYSDGSKLTYTPNSGATNQVLHGSAAGAPGFSQVSMTADISGIAPIANGGTNTNATPTAGGVDYGTGIAQAYSAAGSAGQALLSGGTGAPTWDSNLDDGTTTAGVITHKHPTTLAPGALSSSFTPALLVTAPADTGVTTDDPVVKINGANSPTFTHSSVPNFAGFVEILTPQGATNSTGSDTMVEYAGLSIDRDGACTGGLSCTDTPAFRVGKGHGMLGDTTSAGAASNYGMLGLGTYPAYALTTMGNRTYHQVTAAPTSCAVSQIGSAGTQRWDYYVIAKDHAGNTTTFAYCTTTTGNVTLGSSNYNTVSWTASATNETFDVYGVSFSGGSPSTTGSLSLGQSTTSYDDKGTTRSAYTLPSRNSTGDVFSDGPIVVNGTTPAQQITTTGDIQVNWMSFPTPNALTGAGASGGAKTYTYYVVAVDAFGNKSGTATTGSASTAVGATTLSVSNPINISWTAIAGAICYDVVRSVATGTPSTTGSIALCVQNTTTFTDTGLAASAYTANPLNTNTGYFVSKGQNGAYAVMGNFGSGFNSAMLGYTASLGPTAMTTNIAFHALSTGVLRMYANGSGYTEVSNTQFYPGIDANNDMGAASNRWRHFYGAQDFGIQAAGASAPNYSFLAHGGGEYLKSFTGPTNCSVSNTGSAGSTFVTYLVVAVDLKGNFTGSSNACSTPTSNATLTGSNFNAITWTAGAGNGIVYNVYRVAGTLTSPNNYGRIVASTSAASANDTGANATALTASTTDHTADLAVGSSLSVGTNAAPTATVDVGSGGGIKLTALADPVAPTLAITSGAAGAFTYQVIARDNWGNRTNLAFVSTSVGPTTLDSTHFITINWTAVTGATSYDVVRSAGGAAQGSIYLGVAGTSAVDYGQTTTAYTAPTANRTGEITGDRIVGNHHVGAGSAPTIATQPATGVQFGVSPTAVITQGSDSGFVLTLNTGTGTAAFVGGTEVKVADVAFAKAWNVAPRAIDCSPANGLTGAAASGATGVVFYAKYSATTTTQMSVYAIDSGAGTLTASSAFPIVCTVIE